MSTPKILIAAGGTGGHIYPALAIAEALKKLNSNVTVEFVGTPHGLENRIIPLKGFKLHHIPIGRLNRNVSITERLMTLIKLPWALVKSIIILKRVQPEFVLGVGGHASGPLLLMASLLRYRTAIWEPNAMPGMANRLLSRFVDECWVVFKEARPLLKAKSLYESGMPIRVEIEKASAPAAAVKADGFHVLVFGGSQGARGLNNAVCSMLKGGHGLDGISFVHQTGPADLDRIKADYGDLLKSQKLEVHAYLDDMATQYSRADLVVCRAGTGTLSELAACGKVAILVPFPFASDNHQQVNAESLVSRAAAVMILQKDLTPEFLAAEILRLKADVGLRESMSRAIGEFHQPLAAKKLAAAFLKRISIHATR